MDPVPMRFHGTLSFFVSRERGFEFKWRLVSERRVQALIVVDVNNEAIDVATSISEVGEGSAMRFSQEPWVGVKVNSKRPVGWVVSQALVSFEMCAE